MKTGAAWTTLETVTGEIEVFGQAPAPINRCHEGTSGRQVYSVR